jgi:hypothetical protein
VKRLLLLGGVIFACGRGAQQATHVRATVTRPPRDTTRIALPATFRRCPDNRAILIEAIDPRGDGVVTLLRYGDSLASKTYSIINPTDVSALGAAVGIRYMARDVPHLLSLDTGSFSLTFTGKRLSARARGSGIENAVRTRATIEYMDLEEGTPGDSLSCMPAR